MSASPGAAYLYDTVGNRTQKVSGGDTVSYVWDSVNRMVGMSTSGPGGTKNIEYKYRADGMRVRKAVDGLTERFYYDGQMPVESDKGGVVTRNFVGARGIVAIVVTTVSLDDRLSAR